MPPLAVLRPAANGMRTAWGAMGTCKQPAADAVVRPSQVKKTGFDPEADSTSRVTAMGGFVVPRGITAPLNREARVAAEAAGTMARWCAIPVVMPVGGSGSGRS